MDNGTAIKVDHLSKDFKLPHENYGSIKSAMVNFYHRDKGYEMQKALEDISFEIKKGEFFGIVGRNGSGKSTLLKVLAGIYLPTKGGMAVNGQLTPFIELGVGFNPELTGRENIYLNGALLGFSRKDMKKMYKDIVSFAELDKFMDQKLKNYSSGMQVRLAFSISIRVRSDILLIDEVLAVGDAAFQSKCFDYFQSLRNTDTTVVFVSHDQAALQRFCRKGVLLNNGKLIKSGDMKDILKEYSKIVMAELDKGDEKFSLREGKESGYAVISNTSTETTANKQQTRFTFGEEIYVSYALKIKREIIKPIAGITIFQKNVDNAIYATNTLLEGKELGTLNKGDTVEFRFKLPSGLNNGEYYVEPAVANDSASFFYDQQPKATTFFINGSNNPFSLINKPSDMTIKKRTAKTS